ncbi:MAG: primosomal protein N', partial [bacterium]
GGIIVDGTSERKVMEASLALSGRLPVREGIRILGPSPAPLLRIRNRYRWHLLVLARNHALLASALSAARGMDAAGIRVTTRIDPVQLL